MMAGEPTFNALLPHLYDQVKSGLIGMRRTDLADLLPAVVLRKVVDLGAADIAYFQSVYEPLSKAELQSYESLIVDGVEGWVVLGAANGVILSVEAIGRPDVVNQVRRSDFFTINDRTERK